ncbi:hypothetical protein HDU79_007147 [Rhizoclosmatium sp. JEL0117]|nr:hypothetical protein HDU79_007147 [Rhizoclosmatium sp. JEL0117]
MGDDQTSEWERQWTVVQVNPDDFAAWELLLRQSEAHGQSNVRLAFDSFLEKFPLCFGYWKKYADSELRNEGPEKAEEVFERAVVAIHNSIDLWNHYCQFKIDNCSDPDAVRAVFERASQGVGYDFLSHTFWDKYIDYEETRNKDPVKALAILDRVIRIPLHQYSRYFEKFAKLLPTVRPTDAVSSDELERLSADIRAPTSSKEYEIELRQKILALKTEVHTKTQIAVQKLWAFEAEIKRPYFHIKPMDDAQLANWRKYLDFLEAAVDSGEAESSRLYVLYERCMVPCALYEEFWLRYARCLTTRGDFDGARNVYYRAANLFLATGRTELRLEYAAFEEEQGKIQEAGAIFTKLMESVPGHIETLYKYAHFMRRNYGIDKADECFVSAVSLVNDDKAKGFLIASRAKFIYAAKGSTEEARQIYREHLSTVGPESKSLLLQYFLFELNLPGPTTSVELEAIRSAWDALKSSTVFTEYEKLMLGNRYADYLNERDTDVIAYRALIQFLHQTYRMPTSEEAVAQNGSRKRGISDDGDDKMAKMARSSAGVTPIISAAVPQAGNAGYGGYTQQPQMLQQQQGMQQWGGYGGYGGY